MCIEEKQIDINYEHWIIKQQIKFQFNFKFYNTFTKI